MELMFEILLFLSILTILYKSVVVWHKLKEYRITRNKFSLFAVRDRFVQLVASGDLTEDSWIFQSYYVKINRIIQHQHEFNLINLVRAMKDETVREPAEEFLRRLLSELENSTPHTVSAVEDFYQSIVEIMVINSWVLRTSFKVQHHGTIMWSILEKYFRPQHLAEPHIGAHLVYNASSHTLKQVRLVSVA